jgi:hypothetical protein
MKTGRDRIIAEMRKGDRRARRRRQRGAADAVHGGNSLIVGVPGWPRRC